MSDQLGLAGQLVADSEHQSGLRYQLRICRFCHRILSERQNEIDELFQLPPVAQLYEVALSYFSKKNTLSLSVINNNVH